MRELRLCPAPPRKNFFNGQYSARPGGGLIAWEGCKYLPPSGAGQNLTQPSDRRLLKAGIPARQEIVFLEDGNEMQAELQGGRLDTDPRINHTTGNT